MIEFAPITAFQLIRRIAAGEVDGSGLYLLICADPERAVIEEDLLAEYEVQLGVLPLRIVESATAQGGLNQILDAAATEPALLYVLDRWRSDTALTMDRNVARLQQSVVKLLVLANVEVAERLLFWAPNLRSRLTDVLTIISEAVSGSS